MGKRIIKVLRSRRFWWGVPWFGSLLASGFAAQRLSDLSAELGLGDAAVITWGGIVAALTLAYDSGADRDERIFDALYVALMIVLGFLFLNIPDFSDASDYRSWIIVWFFGVLTARIAWWILSELRKRRSDSK